MPSVIALTSRHLTIGSPDDTRLTDALDLQRSQRPATRTDSEESTEESMPTRLLPQFYRVLGLPLGETLETSWPEEDKKPNAAGIFERVYGLAETALKKSAAPMPKMPTNSAADTARRLPIVGAGGAITGAVVWCSGGLTAWVIRYE